MSVKYAYIDNARNANSCLRLHYQQRATAKAIETILRHRQTKMSYSAVDEVLTAPVTQSSSLSMRERLITWDKDTSRRFYDMSYSNTRLFLLFLELSGHGVLWVVLPLAWYVLRPGMTAPVAASVLNYIGLAILDLIVIGVLKPLVRRPRPAHNGGMTAVTIHAIDQYSFPSGHATRAGLNAAYIAYLQYYHPQTLYSFMRTPLFLAFVVAWATAVAVSRVALGRHHVLDVTVGLALGVAYVIVWHKFWISADVADTVRRHLRHAIFGSPL